MSQPSKDSNSTASGTGTAAIFDLDGTLVDNMRFHIAAWVEMARRLGVPLSADRFQAEHTGKKNEEILTALLARPLTADELAAWADEKERTYRALYGPHVAPLAGAEPLLLRLRRAGVPLALATAAPAENRALILGALGWGTLFDATVGPEDAARGKPAPDIFLAAARSLSIPPQRCVVFEDAPNGVSAGKAAGMRVAGVTTLTPAPELLAAGADWTFASYEALPEGLSRALFGAES